LTDHKRKQEREWEKMIFLFALKLFFLFLLNQMIREKEVGNNCGNKEGGKK
jgi:hypothetical protein